MGRNNCIKNLSILEIGNIELYLNENKSPTQISLLIGRDEATVRKEIKNYSRFSGDRKSCKSCINYSSCIQHFLCNELISEGYCSSCKGCKLAIMYCTNYSTVINCSLLKRNHHVCNGCDAKMRQKCKNVKVIYEAKYAIDKHNLSKQYSRKQPKLSSFPDEFKEYISNRIKAGISPEIIVNTLPDKFKQFKVACSTLYEYIDLGLLDCCNLDLRNKVKRIPYGSSTVKRNTLKNHHLNGRHVSNLTDDERSEKILGIAEMDTVEGLKGGDLLFTIMIPYFSLMLAFKISNKTQEQVIKKLDELEKSLEKYFYILFEKMITDNGGEFLDFEGLELSIDGNSKRMSIFYTNAYASYEKPHVENNHKLVRYLIEKGYDISKLSADNILCILNRINNYPRKRFNFHTPLRLLEEAFGKELINKLGFYHISICDLDMKRKRL